MLRPVTLACACASLLLSAPALQAQMAEMPDSPRAAAMPAPATLIDTELQHTSSGTSLQPPSTPMSMLMSGAQHGGWRLMLHGQGSISDIQQFASDTPAAPPAAICAELNALCVPSIRRGGDKLFSTNWLMPMAQRSLGHGELTVRVMLSLEPATITGRAFPELFQQGETAYGKPIVDGQHPHDFFMEVAALYDLRLGEHALLNLYAAPVGDPALGPTAYPHRLSASEDPLAPLSHHQQDSTHIAFNVVTGGLTAGPVRAELSGFHGAEPTEARWHFQPSPNGLAIDSYATRLTFVPGPHLTAQYSFGRITSPEALNPGQDQRRQTASLMYNRQLGAHHDTTSMPGMDMGTPATGNWANTFVWGRTRNLTTGLVEDSYLAESLLQFRTRNYVWTRVESAARTSELLRLASLPGAATSPEIGVGHVQAYSFGYDHDLRRSPTHLLVAPGAQFTVDRSPDALATTYGRYPFAAVAFVRFRLR